MQSMFVDVKFIYCTLKLGMSTQDIKNFRT